MPLDANHASEEKTQVFYEEPSFWTAVWWTLVFSLVVSHFVSLPAFIWLRGRVNQRHRLAWRAEALDAAAAALADGAGDAGNT